MNARRFSFGPPQPDIEIMKRASGIKIDLYRDTDGDLHGEVEIRCGFGLFGDGREDFDGSKAGGRVAVRPRRVRGVSA